MKKSSALLFSGLVLSAVSWAGVSDRNKYTDLVDLTEADPERVYFTPAGNWAVNQPASNLFDGIYGNSNRAGRYSANYKIVYEFDDPTIITAYSVTSEADAVNRAPGEWKFCGSNDFNGTNFDDATWDELDCEDEYNWTVGETRFYDFKNTVAYKFYCIHVIKNCNRLGGSALWSELDLFHAVSHVEQTGNPVKFGDIDYTVRSTEFESEVTVSAFEGEWMSASGTERATCLGYKRYERTGVDSWKLVDEDAATSVTYTAPFADVRVEWLFDAQVKIDVVQAENGSVTGGGWYASGETCTLVVVPDDGYQFAGWEDDHGSLDADQLVFTVGGALCLRPRFVRVASDVVYVSNSGSDEADGTNIKTPFKTISHALAYLGASGGTVNLLDGTYQENDLEANDLVLDAPVKIVGWSGDATKAIVVPKADCRSFTLSHEDAVLKSITIRGCGSTGSVKCNYGTAVYMTAGAIEDCVVTGTFCRYYDAKGSVYMTGGRISRTTFTDCYMRAAGACVYATGGLIEDCLMSGNAQKSATDPGTYVVELAGAVTMVNCTVTGNHMKSASGVNAANGDAKVVNCVIYGNVTDNGVTSHVYGGSGACFERCLVDAEIPDSTDCIVGGLVFADAANGDYRLLPSSRGFDEGKDVGGLLVSETDILGRTRVIGEAIDIGAFEHQQTDFVCSFVCSLASKLTPVEASFVASVLNAGDGDVTYAWDFGDGTAETNVNERTARHIYSVGGTYDVVLCVSANGRTVESRQPALIKVSPPVIYVSTANKSGTAPYDSEEKATPSLKVAVDFAEDGAVVRMLPGTYDQGTVQEISKAISVEGVTGDPADVLINNTRQNADVRTLVMHNSAAVVSGVTLANGRTNGNTTHGATLYFGEGGGTVSNCVIRNGKTYGYASWAGGVAMKNGLLTHCVVTGDFTSDPDVKAKNADECGVVVYLNGANARMENCLIHDIVAKPITGNESKAASCVGPLVSVVYGTMANCTVAVDYTHRGGVPATVVPFNGGSAIYCANNASAKIINCVATGFKRYDGTVVPFGGQASRFFACAGDAAVEGFEIAVDTPEKMFADPANGDHRPFRGGVLCNAGAAVELSSTTDLAGNPRVHKVIDIGCYELPPAKGLSIVIR